MSSLPVSPFCSWIWRNQTKLWYCNRKTWFQRKRGKEKEIRKVNKRRRQNNDMGQGVIPPRNAISPARWAAVLWAGKSVHLAFTPENGPLVAHSAKQVIIRCTLYITHFFVLLKCNFLKTFPPGRTGSLSAGTGPGRTHYHQTEWHFTHQVPRIPTWNGTLLCGMGPISIILIPYTYVSWRKSKECPWNIL